MCFFALIMNPLKERDPLGISMATIHHFIYTLQEYKRLNGSRITLLILNKLGLK